MPFIFNKVVKFRVAVIRCSIIVQKLAFWEKLWQP